jgi:hypothetical protein
VAIEAEKLFSQVNGEKQHCVRLGMYLKLEDSEGKLVLRTGSSIKLGTTP